MARNYLPATARVLLGVVMLLTGLNKIFWFAPMPHMSPALTAFMGALKETGYFLPFIGIVEATGGALLLVNRFVASRDYYRSSGTLDNVFGAIPGHADSH